MSWPPVPQQLAMARRTGQGTTTMNVRLTTSWKDGLVYIGKQRNLLDHVAVNEFPDKHRRKKQGKYHKIIYMAVLWGEFMHSGRLMIKFILLKQLSQWVGCQNLSKTLLVYAIAVLFDTDIGLSSSHLHRLDGH